MWLLIPAVVVPPLLLNLFLWRVDRKRVSKLPASQSKTSSVDLPGDRAPGVSFLVAAWNEESALRRCIEAIQRLDYPNLEIVLCAGGTDGTWRIASEFSDPRLILLAQQAGDGKQKSLQRCLEKATGEIIYLLDAGCLITGAAFARMVGPILSRREQAMTNSPCTPFPEQLQIPFVASQCASQVYTAIRQPKYVSALLGANSAIRREALERAGGFDPAIRTGGDYELGKRLARQGTRVRYEVEALLPREFQVRVPAYLRQQARWIRNVVIHGMRFGEYREAASCLFTSVVGLAMLVLPCISLVSAFFPRISPAVAPISAAVWGLAFSHAFFSRLRYVDVAARWLGVRFPRRGVPLLPVFLLVDFLAWAIPLFQYPSKALRERW